MTAWDGWWELVVVYLVVFGVYLACFLAAIASSAVLHGRAALRFRRAAPTAGQPVPVAPPAPAEG